MPRITISIQAPNESTDSDLLTLDLPLDLTVADLKASVQAETNFPASSQQFFHNGQTLSPDTKTLGQAGIKDGEMLAMLVTNPETASNSAQQSQQPASGQMNQAARRRRLPTAHEIESQRLGLLSNPTQLAQIREARPDLFNAINDSTQFRQMWFQMAGEEEQRERERQAQLRLLNEDPFNIEAQKKIEEIIRQERVIENLQHAYEHNPEVFARVTMLYIQAEVNGHPVKAFVDSGAQATIMSPSCAEACGIMRLIDRRYAGIAKGVGTAQILGRVHSAEIKIGDVVMPCAFTVMEGKDVDLLFGLDMLKRYQACIDLKRGVLVLGDAEVPFLPESEIPQFGGEGAEPTVPGPNGTEIGGKSGAVRPAGAAGSSTQAIGSAPGPSASAAPSSNFRGQGQTLGSSAAASSSTTPQFPEAAVQQLVTLGFSRAEAVHALEACDGSVEHAIHLLFGN